MTSMLSGNVEDHCDAPVREKPISGGVGPTMPSGRWDCDPLEPDEPGDEQVTTSVRRLLRLAISAAEAAARFTSEGIDHDPVAWMMAPRAMFDGMAGMDACQEVHHFSRSIVLHALRMGLDADPDAIDVLLGGDDGLMDGGALEGVDGSRGVASAVPHAGRSGLVIQREREEMTSPTPRPQLLTCWVDANEDATRVFAFLAIVTDRPADLVERIVGRFGADAAARALYEVGYDHATAFASAMISDAMADTLVLATDAPESPLAMGLDVFVEQRFVDHSIAA